VFLRDRFAASGMNGQHPSVRELLETHVGQIVIQTDTARVEFRSPADGMTASCNSGPSEAPTIVTLPWGRKTLSAVEGKAPTPSAGNLDLRARDAVLTAIGKARLWIKEIVAGGSLADIAKREGRCQRQIRLLAPLAFMPPGIVNSIVDEDIRAGTVTSLAKNVPLIWTASCAPAK